MVRAMAEKYGPESEKLNYFKLWLVLFPILNAVDMVQTWFFFEHETNPLYVLFPNFVFGAKILWSCFTPLALYFSYHKKPRVIYGAALALILLYLGTVLFNLFNIILILRS
jgi:hypothetical protein